MELLTTRTIESLREDFPILDLKVNGVPIAYLDNAATSQKPLVVIESQSNYYLSQNANVHRGVHHLSQISTQAFEDARHTVQQFLNASSSYEVIFTKGCTEAINLVAAALSSSTSAVASNSAGVSQLKGGEVILISQMEHHSNIVPWQLAAAQVGAKIKAIPVTDDGEIDLVAYERLLREYPVKLVAVCHVSNALGTINPVKEMANSAHRAGALILVDGAQAGPHLRIDVQDLDADFYTLSCHKIYAPTGVGVLYGKAALLEQFPAYQGGGDMIHTVDIEQGTTYARMPAKFEAGTPNIAGVIGLAVAIRYLESIGESAADPLAHAFERLGKREAVLGQVATQQLSEIEGVAIHGKAKNKTGIVSFTMKEAHPHDVGTILDHHGVAVRTGHHCCMPLMKRFGLSATTRASFSFYNNQVDVERLIEGVNRVKEMFAS